ncbi:hypothetical protein C943_04506 [Mariniradius saccharolyticus AK6]|uniref:Uncharacterized protein n=1 Tax=Mariniradius saccharolyticus AK6 TaxID=1239962 RepID=M7XYR0_9BACT|nr:hypothetical protein C943_04506 [Mariniradius saccharolyticus AK6]
MGLVFQYIPEIKLNIVENPTLDYNDLGRPIFSKSNSRAKFF